MHRTSIHRADAVQDSHGAAAVGSAFGFHPRNDRTVLPSESLIMLAVTASAFLLGRLGSHEGALFLPPRVSLRTWNPARDRVFYGSERLACEKARPLFRPLAEK